MSDAKHQNPGAGESGRRTFEINRIYSKSLAFETPNSQNPALQGLKPDIYLTLSTNAARISEEVYEVVLELEATSRHGDSKAYVAEVQQAGLFTIAGYSEEELDYMLGSYCPTILYPFAQDTISQLTGNGGFVPLNMPPINFDTVRAQQGATGNRRAIAPVTTRIEYK